MSKLQRGGYLAISTIAAASALFVVGPAGAFAAEEPSDGSTSAETVVEPSGGSSQPSAPTATEWTPQGADTETSGGGKAPLEHGSSVGSGAVAEKAGSDSEKPSSTPDSSGSYEPEPSIPSTFDEPASTSRAGSGVHSVQPTAAATAPAAKVSRPVDVAVGGAISVGHSASPHGDGINSAPSAAAASFVGSGDRGSTSSYALPLVVVIVLGLTLGFAGVRLRRRRRRRRLEALWREQDAEWEAALLRFGLGQVSEAPEPSFQPLQRVNAA
ncbi:MAG TPA: hypothetical protein VIM28_11175 [Solirubrobacterales bacterium]